MMIGGWRYRLTAVSGSLAMCGRYALGLDVSEGQGSALTCLRPMASAITYNSSIHNCFPKVDEQDGLESRTTALSMTCGHDRSHADNSSFNVAPRSRAPVVRRDEASGEVVIETMSVLLELSCCG